MSVVVVDAVVVDAEPAVSSGVRRFMVGRSASSAGLLPVCVVEAVVPALSPPEVVLSGTRRVNVGRSGSSVDGVVAVEVVSVAVPELDVSGVRRFMVGLSGSPLDVAAGLDVVVSALLFVVAGLLWALPADVVSVVGFEPK